MRRGNAEEGFCNHEDCNKKAMSGYELCVEHQAQADVPAPTDIVAATLVKEDKPSIRKENLAPKEADPVMEGSRMAERLIAEEEEERLKFWQEAAEKGRGGKLRRKPPTRLSARRSRFDITVMRDPETGIDLVKPGHSPRWVREVDNAGNPSDQRIEEFKFDGYEVVRTKSGEPLRSIFGVAMQAPIDKYAKRIASSMPQGALNRASLMSDAKEMIHEVNRRAGETVAGVVTKDVDSD